MAVVGIDHAGRIRSFDDTAERMSGMRREAVLGQPFADAMFRMRAAEDVAWTFVPHESGAGGIAVFAFGEDVSARREEARKTREAERIATVAALGTSLAHEIRNPLNGALLHVNVLERLLERQGADDECVEALEVVEQEIRRLSRLVSEFLEFAQPSPPVAHATSAADVVARLRSLVTPRFDKAGVVLQTHVADVAFETDVPKLKRAIEQLLVNALEASSMGDRVKLGVTCSSEGVRVEVEDQGAGITDPELALFEPFVSTKAKGTGLGLAIARRMVTDLGGTLDFTSQPGRTVFSITLPTSPLSRNA
ncbi:integral membrane sensor signal transduction histidine kinase [Labilithrix luteola]|uniref:histidine kinase n=1 Tax=Labilithrix luteola TaxID=1391654 RepID=A0A0K1Q3V8_9BACT|nr:integral membrane sensor signal transduction histidine kinase [Labilithrix luteola]